MPSLFGGVNLDDAAAFKATYAGLRSLTDGDYRISFDFPGEKFEEVAKILSQGGKPSAAKGTWFAIARLNSEGVADSENSASHVTNTQILQTSEPAAGATVRSPSRKLSQDAWLKCNEPMFRVFLEQCRRHAIPANNHINNADEAKHVLRPWMGIKSLSELDRDSTAASRWEEIKAMYKLWQVETRYVEAP